MNPFSPVSMHYLNGDTSPRLINFSLPPTRRRQLDTVIVGCHLSIQGSHQGFHKDTEVHYITVDQDLLKHFHRIWIKLNMAWRQFCLTPHLAHNRKWIGGNGTRWHHLHFFWSILSLKHSLVSHDSIRFFGDFCMFSCVQGGLCKQGSHDFA